MEPIKNLDVLIMASERMQDTFRAFKEIPEVLKALQAAQNYPKELDKAILNKKDELKSLEKAKAIHQRQVDALSLEVAQKVDRLNGLDEELKKKIAENTARENHELEVVRKANNDAVESSIKTMNHEIAGNERRIRESEKELARKLAEHEAIKDAMAKTEEEIEARVNAAKAKLSKIKASLEV
jgi:chromosome segregation ATPase